MQGTVLPWLPRCAMARFPLCTRRTSRRLSLPSTITMRTSAARIEVLERATEVDRALDVVRARLASFLDACGGLRALHNEAAAFAQHELPAALASNPVLAKLHPSEQPRMAVVPAPRLDLAIELRLTAANIGGPSTRPVASLAAMVAGVTRSGAAKAA
jgi:hypothetical protein